MAGGGQLPTHTRVQTHISHSFSSPTGECVRNGSYSDIEWNVVASNNDLEINTCCGCGRTFSVSSQTKLYRILVLTASWKRRHEGTSHNSVLALVPEDTGLGTTIRILDALELVPPAALQTLRPGALLCSFYIQFTVTGTSLRTRIIRMVSEVAMPFLVVILFFIMIHAV